MPNKNWKKEVTNPKRLRLLSFGLLFVIILLVALFVVLVFMIQNAISAQARSREVRVRYCMGLTQSAMEQFADNNDGNYPGGLKAINKNGNKLIDYLPEANTEGKFKNQKIHLLFNHSVEKGFITPAPDFIPEGEIWVYTDALDSLSSDGSIYNIFGSGQDGKILEMGMVNRYLSIVSL